jgi:hypothetical protein
VTCDDCPNPYATYFFHRGTNIIGLCIRCYEQEVRRREQRFGEPTDGTLFDDDHALREEHETISAITRKVTHLYELAPYISLINEHMKKACKYCEEPTKGDVFQEEP